MSWLAPLGFLGLLGVIALIVIYIIKPNYQNKVISSTFVWRLSLKYRRKRLPINRLNNILVFLCQLLILTICASLLAQPVIASEKLGDENEKVIIIDASAGMMVGEGNETRFMRAVEEAKALVRGTLAHNGLVSVILADQDPKDFLVQRASAAQEAEIYAELDKLLEGATKCSYSSANLDKAVELAEKVLNYNYEAQVYLYTATEYLDKNGIHVVDVSREGEWNAAVLNCMAEMDQDNHYKITVDVGCYGRTEQITVFCQVHGANGKDVKMDVLSKSDFFDPSEEEKTFVFSTDDMNGVPLYSFDYLEVYVSVADSFDDDNSFFLYGGKPQTIRVQYASSIPNSYFGGAVRTIRENMKETWDIDFKELKADEKAATEGFDFYIFEHRMPDVLPTDGLVLLVDPNKAPEGAGFRVGETVPVNSSSMLAAGSPHALTKFVESSRITIAKYQEITSNDGYEELAYYNGQPMILVKNEDQAKVVIWAFDLNYSNLCAMPDFAFLMYNMFNYFIPSTLPSHSFEIGDSVTLNARGTELKVAGNGEEIAFDSSVGELVVNTPGTYTVTQKPMQGDQLIIEEFFVKIPAVESNITKQVDELPLIDVERTGEQEYEDLLFYFAIALVALMFIEWQLQSRKNF